jgi:hypothetical protein
MQIYSKLLFVATLIGMGLEGVEIYEGACAVWQQEYMILVSLLLMSLVARGHEILMTLAGLGVLGFYGFEMYEIFWEGEQCGAFAYELNPLLSVLVLTAVGLALGSQLDGKHSHKAK